MPYLESISPHFQYVKIYTGCSIPPRPAAWCGYIYFKPISAELAKLHSYCCILWYVISCAGCGILPWSTAYFHDRIVAALSSHVYLSLLGAELAKLHSEYCISPHFYYVKIYTSCSIPACPAAYFDSLIRPWRHSPAIFISGCLVQKWPNYIHITVFHGISGM